MKFLFFLLLLVFLCKFFKLYDVKESFYGNCIKSIQPTLTLTPAKMNDIVDNAEVSLGGQMRNMAKNVLSGKMGKATKSGGQLDSTKIKNDLTKAYNNDIENTTEFTDDFLKNPLSDDYEYFDEVNCKLKYLEYDS